MDLCLSSKEFAVNKRGSKYNTRRETRKADPNGQRLRRSLWLENNLYKIQKTTHNIDNSDEVGITPFEEQIGLKINGIGPSLSINNKKLFETIDSLVNENALIYDEKYELIGHGTNCALSKCQEKNCRRIYIAYFNINDLIAKQKDYVKKWMQYNANCGLDGLNSLNKETNDFSLTKYLVDQHYSRMVSKHSKITKSQWFQLARSLPKEINNIIRKNGKYLDDFNMICYSYKRYCHNMYEDKNNININETIRKVDISSNSVGKYCNLKRCMLHDFDTRCYWSPRRNDNDSDYLQVDLGANCYINAVSTRGRPLVREENKETKEYQLASNVLQTIEYVKRYKLFVRADTQNLDNNNNNKNDASTSDNNWIFVGIFIGNNDCETEKCHILQSRHIIARYIRFVPLSKTKDGFYGSKSMRVGIYGKIVCKKNEIKINKKEIEINKKILSDNSLKLLNKKEPYVMISIFLPSKEKNNLTEKNGFCNKVYEGASCDCPMCGRGWNQTKKVKSQRQRFAKLTKTCRNSNKFGLYDDIDYLV